MSDGSDIIWRKVSEASREQTFEAIDLIYNLDEPHMFGGNIGLILSCIDVPNKKTKGEDCIHKLDIVSTPDFSLAKLRITHEVTPDQGACSQIIRVSQGLKVAGFDSGYIVPIKNFGLKKTFNCDVHQRLNHHHGAVNALAVNKEGTEVASGSTAGDLVLYKARVEDVTFFKRTKVGKCVTGLAYSPEKKIPGVSTIIYSTLEGNLGIIDTRCNDQSDIISINSICKKHLNISSLCHVSNRPGMLVYLGCATGEVVGTDLRKPDQQLASPEPSNGCIRRMKEVNVKDTQGNMCNFIVYTDQSNELQIYDVETMQKDDRWVCDRLTNDEQRDFVQVGDALITCGRRTSIGHWLWDGPAVVSG